MLVDALGSVVDPSGLKEELFVLVDWGDWLGCHDGDARPHALGAPLAPLLGINRGVQSATCVNMTRRGARPT